MRYRVTVQPVGEDADDTPPESIMCNGYMLVADRGEIVTTVVQQMRIGVVAEALADDENLMKAVDIAKMKSVLYSTTKEA